MKHRSSSPSSPVSRLSILPFASSEVRTDNTFDDLGTHYKRWQLGFYSSEISPTTFSHLSSHSRPQSWRATSTCLWTRTRLQTCRAEQHIGYIFQISKMKNRLMCTLNHRNTKEIQSQPPLFYSHGAMSLLLSQATIIESQVGINARSCTWLGQKQLLQGGNVFFYAALHID